MKKNKIIVLLSLIWEILRYVFMFLLTVRFFIMQINENSNGIFWLLSISSCSLLMPLILILLINNFDRNLIRIFYAGKIFQIFPFFLLIISRLFSLNITLNYLISELISRNMGLIISFLFIDLLFLSLLLSYNIRGDYNIRKKNVDNLPDVSDIPISDVSVLEKEKKEL